MINKEYSQLKIIICNEINSCVKSYEIDNEEQGIKLFNERHNKNGYHYEFIYVKPDTHNKPKAIVTKELTDYLQDNKYICDYSLWKLTIKAIEDKKSDDFVDEIKNLRFYDYEYLFN